MDKFVRELGNVKLVQVQPTGLIVKTQSAHLYDPSKRVEVEKLLITSLGIEAETEPGNHVLDIHHINHPDKEYGKDDLVSIGFTSHYEAMRARFGDHMVNGIAGENIIVEYDQEVWMDDLGKQIVIESGESGHKLVLDMERFAPPCNGFSHFSINGPLFVHKPG